MTSYFRSRLMPISSSSSYSIDPFRVRFGAQLMYGRLKSDDDDIKKSNFDVHHDNLQELRKRALVALEKDNTTELMILSHDAVQWMEGLPASHPRHFPSYLAFVNKPSPWNEIFEDSLKKVYSKVRDCCARAQPTKFQLRPNNASGIAVWGPRGTGKSNGLRLLALVPPLLFPNHVVSAYIDYRTHLGETYSPHRILSDALENHSGEKLPANVEWESVLDAATKDHKTFVLCADEFEQVYTTKRVWDEFATIATRFDHSLFLADSGSRVSAMVECKGYEQKLRGWYPQFTEKLPASLNGDKLAVRELKPFTTREQYLALFKTRNVPLLERLKKQREESNSNGDASKQDQVCDEYIDDIHYMTGGRLRAMQRGDGAQSLISLPRHDSAAFYVLDQLARKQAAKGLSSPFDLEKATEEEILRWLDDWKKEHVLLAAKDDTDINTLLDTNVLMMIDGLFTFSVPDYYRLVRNVRPQVFISHAYQDKDHPTLKSIVSRLQAHNVHVVIDTDFQVKQVMAERSLDDWMDKQVGTTGSFVIAMLSSAYKKQAMVKGSGVDTELELMNKQGGNVRILAVSLDGGYDSKLGDEDERLKKLISRRVYLTDPDEKIDSLIGHICRLSSQMI